ncbi:dual OB domain-containing protein [Yoonia sediminilitoris]|uniref:Dual OB-containing domain-containing protein n=1 Tax=Yoonia sediminilitoris TaxID=1286148 RepID=A0A2T6KF32_9RHOB|nr:hypothetical protein [Yoonia sediminilitoris]PUB13718.1 hypothetical protein C8N45_107179 [Yoonia sediminilitoris]RCW94888.1 hypothetical protein DFP92_107179 [Yoonia sediminilitoris]
MSLKELQQRFPPTENKQVLVTEVTRMTGGQVCVAGLDIHSGEMVRPLQPGGHNWPEEKWVGGGYLAVGNVIFLAPAKAGNPSYPHANEDFRVAKVGKQGEASVTELYAACAETSDQHLEDIFGGNLVEGKYALADSECRSLGSIAIQARRLRASAPYGKPQVSYQDAQKIWHNLTVTELYTKNYADAEAGAQSLSARLTSAGWQDVILRLGLARPWDGGEQGFNPKRCYLQLNGIILPN